MYHKSALWYSNHPHPNTPLTWSYAARHQRYLRNMRGNKLHRQFRPPDSARRRSSSARPPRRRPASASAARRRQPSARRTAPRRTRPARRTRPQSAVRRSARDRASAQDMYGSRPGGSGVDALLVDTRPYNGPQQHADIRAASVGLAPSSGPVRVHHDIPTGIHTYDAAGPVAGDTVEDQTSTQWEEVHQA